MPTYDYQCTTCGTAFELFQSFSDDALKKCPSKRSGNSPEGCTAPGKGNVQKVYSAPGITFKGSGFYKTDSRGATSSTKVGSDSKASSSDSSSSSESASTSSSSGD